ncbi:response regulator transcription factor [Leptolyngbya sp. FACHB-36]|uniref:response regulator n=1 Tax=Leptolyngbya sp. FACHB-36 TaxID=2692808 RepID=UPI001681030A|nr:response regulator transcription factor [Leptolyngbya sp. FACHB-36]MBD2019063.1 response regulator transcription factor [Leptolyngbya sp. FACHB-36]
MIRLLVVDDHSIFRQGLSALLSIEDDFVVIGQAANGQEAIELTETLQPDVVLMDMRMPVCDGVEATREIHRRYPFVRILILSMFEDSDDVQRSLQAGALGYLLKNTPDEQFVGAIRSVYLGYAQLSPSIAPKVFARLQCSPPSSAVSDSLLTPRELDVLRLIGKGSNNREIAEALHLTEGTVRNYVTRILSQLGVRDRIQAVIWAQQHLLD